MREAKIVELFKVQIKENKAAVAGAAIWASQGQGMTNIKVVDSVFEDNYASQALVKLDFAAMEI